MIPVYLKCICYSYLDGLKIDWPSVGHGIIPLKTNYRSDLFTEFDIIDKNLLYMSFWEDINYVQNVPYHKVWKITFLTCGILYLTCGKYSFSLVVRYELRGKS